MSDIGFVARFGQALAEITRSLVIIFNDQDLHEASTHDVFQNVRRSTLELQAPGLPLGRPWRVSHEVIAKSGQTARAISAVTGQEIALLFLELNSDEPTTGTCLNSEKHGRAADVFCLGHSGVHIGWRCNTLAVHLNNDVANTQTLARSITFVIDTRDHNAAFDVAFRLWQR
ncbi:MAG: hypothetical protein AAFQ11_13455, partial [Pseudomonadota bacterium]